MIEIIKALLTIIQLLFIARFHFEFAKVNGFIEPVNSIRKITNLLVLPAKRLIPLPWAKKFAAIMVAYLLSVMILLSLIGLQEGAMMVSFWIAFIRLALTWIAFLKYGMILFVLMSWVLMFAGGSSSNPLLTRAAYLLEKTFQPLLQPIQRIIPSFGGLDFSPIAFFFGLMFIEGWVYQFANVGVTQ